MRTRSRFNFVLAAALAAAGTSSAFCQTPDSVRVTPRIIGVFDSRTGTPLAGVQVRDAFSGAYAVTTATGTALLNFLTFRGNAAFVELRISQFDPCGGRSAFPLFARVSRVAEGG